MPEPIVNELADMFPDTMVVQRRTGVSSDGFKRPVYGDPFDVPVRITKGSLEYRTLGGQNVSSTVQAITAGAFGLKVNDLFTLPERFSPRSPPAVDVLQTPDENGPHHETVMF